VEVHYRVRKEGMQRGGFMRSKFVISFCLLLLLVAIPASADQWNKKTTITFSQPVEIPGMVLQPGTYVFKLLNSSTNRNIVLVYNAEENHLYKMILAIPNYRLNRTEEPVLRFNEGIRGAPDALHAWFYSADQWGQEFVYPKARATQIAEESGERVLEAEITPEEKQEELVAEQIAAVTPEHQEEVFSEEVEEALAMPLSPNTSFEAVVTREPIEELPRTGSDLPMFVLLGFASLTLAGLLKVSFRAN
jgi:LPXTG-motif cell wall-anchored protein